MEIFLSDYAHLFDGNDATLAVQEALRACKEQEQATLHLGGGQLHFSAKYAFEKEYYISNNDYSKKSIIFPLIGVQDLTIDGDGADLLFHGTVLPFVIDQSARITLRNFTVDYPHPFFFQAKITASGPDFVELEYDNDEFRVKAETNRLVFSCEEENWSIPTARVLASEFDREPCAPSAYISPYILRLDEGDDSFLSGMYRFVKAVQVKENVIRLEGNLKCTHTVGNYWVCTFASRENPGIFGNESKDLLVENVTLYHTASMGLICQKTENVTMRQLHTIVRPGSGRCLSVSADSTHFVNCTGAIRYENCRFFNMLDDAGNTHGNYTKFAKKLHDNAMLVTFGHFQQKGVNLYSPGDEIRIIDNVSMKPVASLTVTASSLLNGDYCRIETKEPLPEIPEGFTIENRTSMPELYIHGCASGFNRPRGFLPGTWRHTEITDSSFCNMLCALHFTGDCNDWFESGPVEDVVIRNNRFVNSSYTGGEVIVVSPHVKDGKTPFHKGIVIEDNLFELAEKRFLRADLCEGLVFRNNRFVKNDALPKHGGSPTGLRVNNCPDAVVEEPKES